MGLSCRGGRRRTDITYFVAPLEFIITTLRCETIFTTNNNIMMKSNSLFAYFVRFAQRFDRSLIVHH